MAKKRSERVKDKLAKQRESLQAKRKSEKPEKRPKQRPIVYAHQTALEINNHKLRAMAHLHIEEMEFKEKNKDKLDEHFAKTREQQSKIIEVMHVDE